MDRRRLLRSVPPFLIASSVPSVFAPLAAASPRSLAALLIPQTGVHAALGRSMERAALMAQGSIDKRTFRVFDTAGTPEGTAAAAKAARKAGAGIVLGPVFSQEIAPAVAALGATAPVMTFSNDIAMVDRGAFLLGLTATQVVTAILEYAARRGVRRFAVGGGIDGWDGQVRAAAQTAGAALGLVSVAFAGAATLSLTAESTPDAVLLPSVAALLEASSYTSVNGVQLLAALPSLAPTPETLRRLDGMWLAAPDPEPFAVFARAFEARNGSRPGLIAGLAYDAMRIVNRMRAGGGTDRSALLATGGFRGVCGDLRFRDDGSAVRALTIMAAGNGALRRVAPAAFP